MAVMELPQWLFDVYALSLPRGHGFGAQLPIEAWGTDDGRSWGALTRRDADGTFGLIVMRRRVDGVWTLVGEETEQTSSLDAQAKLTFLLRDGQPPEPLPPGTPARPALHDLEDRQASDAFNLLTTPSHHPAAWVLNQLYMAMPKPDRNWAGDCQTTNFHTRLWEAQLLASFREQGLLVSQPKESPDFRIENRLGGVAWVEAVTANPPVPYNHVNAPRTPAPKSREESFLGPAALRFAKTLGNKLERRYDQLGHVAGHPFVIALADFQASGSMIWSREALIGYLYGLQANVVEIDGRQQAMSQRASLLLGPSAFPAGLFADDRQAGLSAVIFSNACSIAKLNRVVISASAAPLGLRYTRIGEFFDRRPGALKGIPFCLDITSDEYRGLWPQGSEPWSAELEIFHNPFARHPLPHGLLPDATHWFRDEEGDISCSAVYAHAILWSQTLIQDADQPPPDLDSILRGGPSE